MRLLRSRFRTHRSGNCGRCGTHSIRSGLGRADPSSHGRAQISRMQQQQKIFPGRSLPSTSQAQPRGIKREMDEHAGKRMHDGRGLDAQMSVGGFCCGRVALHASAQNTTGFRNRDHGHLSPTKHDFGRPSMECCSVEGWDYRTNRQPSTTMKIWGRRCECGDGRRAPEG